MMVKLIMLAWYLLVTVVCASPTPKVLRTAVLTPIQTLDPGKALLSTEIRVVENLFDTLLAIDPKTGSIVPQAAERVTITSDGLQLTFTLRRDSYWSDGSQVKAQDYVFALRRLLRPSFGSSYRDELFMIKGAEEFLSGGIVMPKVLGVRALSDFVLEVTLDVPNSEILRLFTNVWTAPIKKESIQFSSDQTLQLNDWIGNGPYVPVRMNDRALLLRRNPHYKHPVYFDEVTVYLVSSLASAVTLYRNQDISLLGYRDLFFSTQDLLSFVGKPDLIFQADLRTFFMRLNPGRAPLSEAPVRRAIAMSIDRPLILSGLGIQGETRALSLLPPGILDYQPPEGYLFGLTAAQRDLKKIGYCMSAQDRGCKSMPSLEILYAQGSQMQKIALSLQSMLTKSLHVNQLTIRALAPEAFNRAIAKGEYMLALDEVSADGQHPFGILEAFLPSRATAGTFYHGDFERTFLAAQAAPTWDGGKLLYRQAEGQLLENAEVIPLFHAATPILMSPELLGFYPNIWDRLRFSDLKRR